MQICSSIESMRTLIHEWKSSGQTVGFVPTMGNLHEGHLKLVEEANKRSDRVVVSIFVNPMQFGENEDFDNYPRTQEQDIEKLKGLSTDAVFIPSADDIYPEQIDRSSFVEVPELSTILCGASRPGHFRGVTTVVNKLFNIVQPDCAVFGLKDYQQFIIIKKMVDDLKMPVQMIGVETVRESDGLAKSSRNGYLNQQQRQQAATIYEILRSIKTEIQQGRKDYLALEKEGLGQLEKVGFKPDYVAIRCAESLQVPAAETRTLAILVAAWLGNTRLIDNIRL
ncbi:MAG: pantoate--beta-alanine ligase [Gammaproteobacteria bacterium]|nr:pantoate--beta-alanine ligase [Gammaproteobacteria bacterium]